MKISKPEGFLRYLLNCASVLLIFYLNYLFVPKSIECLFYIMKFLYIIVLFSRYLLYTQICMIYSHNILINICEHLKNVFNAWKIICKK